jgi:hypothetical protein
MVFINGPFGVGKTSVANVLVERIPGAMMYDPEKVGSFLRRILEPVEKVGDFQDYALWRTLVVEVARQLKNEYGRPLIIPMTVCHRKYFDSITGSLRCVDSDLSCFRLTASEKILRSRILTRLDEEGSHEWCLSHLDAGLVASRDPAFGVEIQTDNRTPADVADQILKKLAS